MTRVPSRVVTVFLWTLLLPGWEEGDAPPSTSAKEQMQLVVCVACVWGCACAHVRAHMCGGFCLHLRS